MRCGLVELSCEWPINSCCGMVLQRTYDMECYYSLPIEAQPKSNGREGWHGKGKKKA